MEQVLDSRDCSYFPPVFRACELRLQLAPEVFFEK